MAEPVVTESFAKDAIIAWFRGEFAAANALIDTLCGHLTQLDGGVAATEEYEEVFAAIHRRRLNWIPVIHMQNYHSISEVVTELNHVAAKKIDRNEMLDNDKVEIESEKIVEGNDINSNGVEEDNGVVDEYEDDSPHSDITHAGSQEAQCSTETVEICSNHEDCQARPSRIKLTKGFTVKEPVRGHMVNVVKGLKLYEDIFSDLELSKLTDFATEMRVAGQNGDLSGKTFILFNKQIKRNKREYIQLGVPIYGHIQDEAAGTYTEPIPALLQSVIDHFIQWQLIPEYKRPNGCVITFFDEGEYSQPFLKPPFWDQPIATLLLSESTMAYGHVFMSDDDGNYRGPLTLPLKQGSLLVMRGNSAETACHVMCPSPNPRVTITFFRIRPDTHQIHSPPTSPVHKPPTLWKQQQPGISNPFDMPNGGTLNGHEAIDMYGGVVCSQLVMLAPTLPMAMSPGKLPCGGTGVFLPWNMNLRKPTKHIPPRAQKGRLLMTTNAADSVIKAGISENHQES
ncbi:hypothetical protein ACFE04_012249 [Oxalis oulophora]